MDGPSAIAALRTSEYGYLDENQHIYLDHTGAGLPARSQLRAHHDRITAHAHGNPHSDNPASARSDRLLASARTAVLRHFNADPDEYVAIFTANATSAIRLVAEAFPFDRDTPLVLTADNHNSVNGVREYARARQAHTRYVPLENAELRVRDHTLRAALRGSRPRRGATGLFAYPAQSNFTGVQHPLDWVAAAQAHGFQVLLDAAAYAPTNPLDLGAVKPDFVPVSWYKILGYPTGVGCLIARREALTRLRRPWFAGGTIHVASAQGQWHRMADDETAFEDGTVNFLGIPDVEVGLKRLATIGMDTVHQHVTTLTERLLTGLAELRHRSGAPLVRLYGPRDTRRRGPTVALNVLDPKGRVVDERVVGRDSSDQHISLRTGCFCNPGAGEEAFALTLPALRAGARRAGGAIDDYLHLLGLPTGGAVRVSLGLPSNLADVEAFLDFLTDRYRDRTVSAEGLAPRLRC